MNTEAQKPYSSSEQIGEKAARIAINCSPEGLPKGVWLMTTDLKEGQRQIPIYDSREDSHHEHIASQFADYKTAIVFGVGLYGITSLVEDPRVGKHKDSDQPFFKAKNDRSPLDKIPIYLPPKNLLEVMDIDKVHPEFRQYLSTREQREFLWEKAGAIHLILPVKEDAPHIHDIFITTPEVWKAKNAPMDQHMPVPTASVFWWHDPDWENIENIMERMVRDAIAGISSHNKHGKKSPWQLYDEVKRIRDEGDVPYDFIVRDSVGELLTARSSHTQIAPALEDQEPLWKVYRTGARSPEEFLKRIGSRHGFRLVEGHRIATREDPPDTLLDDKVDAVQNAVQKDYMRRHPGPRRIPERFWQRLVA